MALFDKEMFNRANQKREEQFGEVDDGLYICHLDDAEIGPSKNSGKNQLKLQWKISADDPAFANKNIFQCVGLEKDNDDDLEVAYGIVAMLASILGIKDMDSFSDNPNMHLTKCIDSEARIEVKTNDGGFKQVKIRKMITKTYDPEYFDSSPQTLPQEEVTLSPGTRVIVTDANGEQKGTVIEVNSEEDIKVQIGDLITTVALSQLELHDWQEEKQAENFQPEPLTSEEEKASAETQPAEIQEKDEVEIVDLVNDHAEKVTFYDLEEGMQISGEYKGATYNGTVYKLDETKDLVFIRVGDKAIPANISTVKIIGNSEIPF